MPISPGPSVCSAPERPLDEGTPSGHKSTSRQIDPNSSISSSFIYLKRDTRSERSPSPRACRRFVGSAAALFHRKIPIDGELARPRDVHQHENDQVHQRQLANGKGILAMNHEKAIAIVKSSGSSRGGTKADQKNRTNKPSSPNMASISEKRLPTPNGSGKTSAICANPAHFCNPCDISNTPKITLAANNNSDVFAPSGLTGNKNDIT